MTKKSNFSESETRTVTELAGTIIYAFEKKLIDSLLNPAKPFPVLLRSKLLKIYPTISRIFNDYEQIRVDLIKEASGGKMKKETDPETGQLKDVFDVPEDKLEEIGKELMKLRNQQEVFEIPVIRVSEFDNNPEINPNVFIYLSWLIVSE